MSRRAGDCRCCCPLLPLPAVPALAGVHAHTLHRWPLATHRRAAAAALLSHHNLLNLPVRCHREDLEALPPEADLDAYAAMPVDQFGMALLR